MWLAELLGNERGEQVHLKNASSTQWICDPHVKVHFSSSCFSHLIDYHNAGTLPAKWLWLWYSYPLAPTAYPSLPPGSGGRVFCKSTKVHEEHGWKTSEIGTRDVIWLWCMIYWPVLDLCHRHLCLFLYCDRIPSIIPQAQSGAYAILPLAPHLSIRPVCWWVFAESHVR